MKDLIRRDEAINAMKNSLYGYMWEVELAIEAVKELPPARRTGKWVHKDENQWECSECRAVLDDDDMQKHSFYYCYRCGVYMQNKDENTNNA